MEPGDSGVVGMWGEKGGRDPTNSFVRLLVSLPCWSLGLARLWYGGGGEGGAKSVTNSSDQLSWWADIQCSGDSPRLLDSVEQLSCCPGVAPQSPHHTGPGSRSLVRHYNLYLDCNKS